jgi:DNA-binding FadR family transcriptional regulator
MRFRWMQSPANLRPSPHDPHAFRALDLGLRDIDIGELTGASAEKGPDECFVHKLFEMRLVLEPAAAELAAARATKEELESIREAFTHMGQHGDLNTNIEDTSRFHDRISQATHNECLIQLNRILLAAMHDVQSMLRRPHHDATLILAAYKNLCEAIVLRCQARARTAMFDLVHEAEQNTLLALRRKIARKRSGKLELSR